MNKRKKIKKILFYIGLAPFIIAILWTLWEMIVHGVNFFEYLVFAGYIYFIFFYIGLVFILISLCISNPKEDNKKKIKK